jgi:2-(1,2-epoxy-1,2-dihydrophenyl)acetyl-CoA isomerase
MSGSDGGRQTSDEQEKFSGFEVSRPIADVALITLDRPEYLNAMTLGMKRDLIAIVERLQFDDRVRVLIFTGMGSVFCAGDDLRALWSQDVDPAVLGSRLPDGATVPMRNYGALRWFSHELNRAVRRCDKLTIAAVNGYALQSGLSLALACDFRLASSSAQFGSATLRFGLMSDEGGHYLLVQQLGVARAMEFIMRRRIVTAVTALQLGLVNEVHDPEDLMSATLTLARELADGPQVAMRMLKGSIYAAHELTFDQSLAEIAAKSSMSDRHDDANEGRDAFRTKRAPRFNAWLEEPSRE